MQCPEASSEFQAELANNSEHGPALTYLADIDVRLNNTEATLPLLEKAVQINSEIELAHFDLGILYENDDRQDDALRELKIADDPAVHWHLGQFL